MTKIYDDWSLFVLEKVSYKERGFKTPKHLIKVGEETLLELAINSLLIDGFVLLKPAKFSNRAIERMSILRASLLIQSIHENGYAEQISVPIGIEAMKYGQFEQKLAALGIVELQGVILRLGSPALMLIAKSGILSSLH